MKSDFDEFLENEGLFADVDAVAIKRIAAYHVQKEMDEKQISKTKMAEKMHTRRSALDRFLDPKNSSATLATIENAFRAIGKKLQLRIV